MRSDLLLRIYTPALLGGTEGKMYSGVATIVRRYWQIYGGWRSVLRSPYFHISAILLAATYNFWSHERWWDQTISILPNLLGFTLGGFALLLGFGDEKFRALLADREEGEPSSIYTSLCATFVHFIVVQLLALIFAVVTNALQFQADLPVWLSDVLPALTTVGYGLGYGLFIYSLLSLLAATLAIFRAATWYEAHQQRQKKNGD